MSFFGETKMSLLRKPWYLSLLILLTWLIVIMRVQDLPYIVHHRPLYQFLGKSISILELESLIFFLGAVVYLKWWQHVGLKSPNDLRNLSLWWLPCLFLLGYVLLVLSAGLPPTRILMVILINTLMIGICEELLFRGILFYGASSSFGTRSAVWITSIIFGVVHINSGFITGDFNASLIQVFNAFMFGLCMVALRIRLDTLIPGIIFHWLWDFWTDLTHLNVNSVVEIKSSLIYIVFFLYGLWLLRDMYLKDTMTNFVAKNFF